MGDDELGVITEDVLTVIAPFLPLDDRLKFIRVNKTWFRAFQSLQNMWRDDVLIKLLRVDQTIGLDKIVSEHLEANSEVDWMKIVQFQFLKLPKKIAVERDDQLIHLGASNYGNASLVMDWKSPFVGAPNEDIAFPQESSIFEFSFDVRKHLEKISDLESRKKRLEGIYSCCFFYELISIGDYVPNLFTDILKVIPISNLDEVSLSNFELKETLSSVLLAILEPDFGGILKSFVSKIFSQMVKPNSTIYENYYSDYDRLTKISEYITPEQVLEAGIQDVDYCPNIETLDSWLTLELFQDTALSLKINEEDFSAEWNSYEINGLYPLYYNAGGNYYDVVKVSLRIEPDGKKIKLTRRELREFW